MLPRAAYLFTSRGSVKSSSASFTVSATGKAMLGVGPSPWSRWWRWPEGAGGEAGSAGRVRAGVTRTSAGHARPAPSPRSSAVAAVACMKITSLAILGALPPWGAAKISSDLGARPPWGSKISYWQMSNFLVPLPRWSFFAHASPLKSPSRTPPSGHLPGRPPRNARR